MNISERVLKAINKEERQLHGVHASALSYDCLRRAYYSQTMKEGYHDLKTLITFWIGRQLHKTPILKHHEMTLKWVTKDGMKIVGTPDDYEDGVVLDKKTCKKIPRSPNDHHKKQLEYYSVLLQNNGFECNEGHLVYIDIVEKNIQPFKVRFRPKEVIEKELLAKAKILHDALKNKKPPERVPGWICSYCGFASICYKGDENKRD